MPLTMHPDTSLVFIHDETWDYICRACMRRGETNKMDVYGDSKGTWIKCKKCKAEERIDLPKFIKEKIRKS